jgi:uncharacterized protein (DUF433 family)
MSRRVARLPRQYIERMGGGATHRIQSALFAAMGSRFKTCYHGAGERRRRTLGSTPMNELLNRITIDPAILHGKPAIRGLRYPVELLLELLSTGMTIDDILADYADLERDDVLAALAYAARLAHMKRMEPIGQ